MHILVLLTDLFDKLGGIQTFNRSLVKSLSNIAEHRGWKVTLLVLNDKGNNTISDFYINRSKVKYLSFNGSKFKFIISAILNALHSSIIVIGHVNYSPLAGILRLFSVKAKLYLIVFGIDVAGKLPCFQRFSLRHLTKIVSISEYTKNQILLFNSFEKSKFCIMPCTLEPFFDEKSSYKDRNDLSLPSGKMILTVSRLEAHERYKNIDLVIEAMPGILKEVPDAFYVVVGDGSDKKRLEKLAKNLSLAGKIIFTGKVSNELLISYYKLCDLFILPSTQEGFGIVFLEAMYFAKPCIGANAGAVPEVVKDRETGYLVEPEKKAISRSVTNLLQDDLLRDKIGKAGKERFEKEFSFVEFQKKIIAILCE
ncbi:MAG: glycosyltransferase family 4 protein [Candidatus Melainabacteria bacterium]|nr:glycosyltransferase family 4 protein [Candidatus Melainabacteria bacterium]